VTGENSSGQNGTDKMVCTKWYTDKMSLDKMAWTKWYGQNDTDKMVGSFGMDYSSFILNIYIAPLQENYSVRLKVIFI